MSKSENLKKASRKLLLLCRKAILMRKHVCIFTILQFLIAITFTLQIRLIFEPQAFRLQQHESAKVSQILRSMPKDVNCRYVPNEHFVNELMSNAARLLHIKITPAAENETYDKNSRVKSLWAVFTSNKNQTDKPMVLDYKIRSYDYSNSRSAIWNDEEPSRDDPYMKTGFIPLQIAIDISFLEMWKNGESSNFANKIRLGRFPYHTLNLLVMPVLLEPSVSIAYSLMIIAFTLIPAEVLHKVVHDKNKGFRELMHVMSMSLTMLYTGWIIYMLIVAIPVTIVCTIILNPVLVNGYALTICIFILLYLITSTCFMFFIGTFFNDSLKACLVGTILWLVLSYLAMTLSEYTEDMSYSTKISTLCLPQSGLLYGLFNFAATQDLMRTVTVKEAESHGNTTNSKLLDLELTRSKNSEDAINLGHRKHQIPMIVILLSWVFHIACWSLLTFYFDKLRPGKHGAAKPWYYPCQKCVSKPLEVDVNYKGTTKWSTVEKTPVGLTPIITIRQITKTFGTPKNQVIAIDGMTIDFYEGEFHIILGHNGAGKSTLLKMIVGMYKPSRGDIYILGKDYNNTQINSQENLIGYCPQDNILVNDLTAIEHVYIFGMLKGMSYKDSFDKAESMLSQLGLSANQNEKIKHFTLGMKRRVCLSMALIGNAKILVLDEPGYGVDPQNRRKIWDTLLAFKEQRTIIMTTNSMEAADILPDRIAIIANGKVECYGTKMYLNRRFGVAYLLSIVIEEDCNLESLTSAIQNFSSDQIKLQTRLGSVIKYDLPRRTAFAKLLQHLEHNIRVLRIKSIGLNVTSIEEQFRRIGFMSNIKSRGGMNTFYNDHEFEMMIRKRRRDLLTKTRKWTRREGRGLSIQQFGIMFYKKCLHVLTLWDVYGYSLLFSLVAFIVCLEMTRQVNLQISTTRVHEINISKYTGSGLGILLHDNTAPKTLLKAFIHTITSHNPNEEDESNYYVSNDTSAVELISKPTWNSMEIREHYFMGIDVSRRNKINILYSVTAAHSGPIAINLLHNALLKYNGCDNCAIRIKTEPILDPAQWQSRMIETPGIRNWQNFSIIVTLFLLLPSISLITKELRSSSKQLQLNAIGMSVMKYWAPIYIVDILIYLLCLLLIASLIPIFYNVTSDVNGIEFFQMLTIFLLYGIAALPTGYILHFFVKRVEITCIIVLILNVITLIFINGSLTHPILMRIISTSGREIIDILFHLIPQYTLACAVSSFLSIHIYNDQCRQLDSCRSSFWAEDPCCQACEGGGCYRPLSIMWNERTTNRFPHSIMVDIVIYLIETLIFIMIIIFIESRCKKRIGRFCEKQIHPGEINESIVEPYVLFEKERVDDFMEEFKSRGSISSNVMLSVQNLSKKFKGKGVVRGINFNVYKNDCLGLLGINGAGKSTIFKILSGEELPMSGKAIIQNYDLIKNQHSFSSMVGYCPQIGGLNSFMTARQNLRLHATLRGVPLDRVQEEVDKWLDVFDLLDYENRKVKHCPWGIKRKICILQSLIADLPIVLLDEPTAGLDAIARQVVCDTLHFVREMDRSLLVTTQRALNFLWEYVIESVITIVIEKISNSKHAKKYFLCYLNGKLQTAMEEAETLCLRIGVLVKGQFVAFGSSEQLKHQHGEYFTLNIVMPVIDSPEKIEQVKKSVETMFTGFHFKSLHVGILRYEIDASQTMYNMIFEKLEKLKIKHPEISESSVSQTTMEQVFLSLCEKYKDVNIPQEKSICLQKFINKIHRV